MTQNLITFPTADQVEFLRDGQDYFGHFPIVLNDAEVVDCAANARFMPRPGDNRAWHGDHLELAFGIPVDYRTLFSLVRDLDLYVDLGENRDATLADWLEKGYPISAAHVWLAFGVLDTVGPVELEERRGYNGQTYLTPKQYPSGLKVRTIADTQKWDAVRMAIKATMFPEDAVSERDPNAHPGVVTRGRLPSRNRGANPSYYGARPSIPNAPLPHQQDGADRIAQLEAQVQALMTALQTNGHKPAEETADSIPF